VRVYEPGGTFSSLKEPLPSVTAYGPSRPQCSPSSRVDVAFDRDCDFLLGPGYVERRSAHQLRLIPFGITGGLRVNVMQRMVAIQYLHGLTHIDGNHMRKVLTASLLDLDRTDEGLLSGQALADIEDNVGEAAVGPTTTLSR